MVGGLVTPPILLAGPAGANLGTESQLYLVSACLIWCGVGTAIQVSRLKLLKTKYYIGTGLISVVGTSFAFTNVALSYLGQSYSNGTCQYAADGKTKLVSPILPLRSQRSLAPQSLVRSWVHRCSRAFGRSVLPLFPRVSSENSSLLSSPAPCSCSLAQRWSNRV